MRHRYAFLPTQSWSYDSFAEPGMRARYASGLAELSLDIWSSDQQSYLPRCHSEPSTSRFRSFTQETHKTSALLSLGIF